ncbi:MAG: chromosome partitioning protein ParB [Verrucomicrobia bacterium]|nr:chromosome partitioning protein ParB [Verrucomicrobiota bacterium]
MQTTDEAVESYADEMTRGTVFPPIDVYFDGATYWLADGFHRFLATKRNGGATILAAVQPGGRSEALRHALGANATNGVYRTNADKRNAAEIALEEWPDKANPVIAELCRVSVDLVRRCRAEMAKSGKLEERETVTGRDGKEYPAQMQKQPRGKTEGKSSDASAGGGGGGFSKGKSDGVGMVGGGTSELERDARMMIRKGEINPFELPTLLTANAMDYAETVVNLLGTMKRDDPLRNKGLMRIKLWVEKALAGEVEFAGTATAEEVRSRAPSEERDEDADAEDNEVDADDEEGDEDGDERE